MDENYVAEALIASSVAIIPVSMMIAGVLVQRYKTQERLRAIEKGVALPSRPSRPALSPPEVAANLRLAGIVFIALGLGLLVLLASLATVPKGVVAVSAVPLLLGIGFLIESRIRRKEMEARDDSIR